MPLVVRKCGRIGYPSALAMQEELVRGKIAGDPHDYLLLLEHDPVYTLGRGADELDVRGADRDLGVPLFRVSRGGGATFHGPGQMVAYPILNLGHGGRDVHRYVRKLETTLVAVCSGFGIRAEIRDGLTGVWTERGKIASIGIGVRRWITFHGVALNVGVDLGYFERIVPCRMPDIKMTTMEIELGTAPALSSVEEAFVSAFGAEFGPREVIWEQAA